MRPSPFLPVRFGSPEPLAPGTWAAVDRLTDAAVLVRCSVPRDGAAREALRAEHARLVQLAHPGLPRVAGFGFLADDSAWLAVDMPIGDPPRGPLGVEALRHLVRGTCEVLAALHAAGLLHGDLSPSSVRLDAVAGRVTLVGLPFAGPPRAGSSAPRRGTLPAPELLRGGGSTPSSDLWSLGALLHEAAWGRPAARAGTAGAAPDGGVNGLPDDVLALRPDLPREFAEAVAGLLQDDPAARPASALEARGLLLRSLPLPLDDGARLSFPLRLAPAFLGRDRELGLLLDSAARASQGRRIRLALGAPEGGGLTRLLAEAEGRLVEAGHVVLVRSVASGDARPFAGLAEDLLVCAGSAASLGAHDEVDRVLEAIAVVQSERSSASRPALVLALDDLHRATPAARADVAELWRRLPEASVLLVTAHAEPLAGWPVEDATVTRVDPFRGTEVPRFLAATLLAPAPDALVALAEGVALRTPAVLLELMRQQLDSGALALAGGAWCVTGPLVPAEAPLGHPVDLTGEDRIVAGVIVVLGRPASFGEIADVTRVPVHEVAATALALADQGLVVVAGASVAAAARLEHLASAAFSILELRAHHDAVLTLHEQLPPDSSQAERLVGGPDGRDFVLHHRARGTSAERAVPAAAEAARIALRSRTPAAAAREARLGLARLEDVPAEGRESLAAHESILHAVISAVLEREGDLPGAETAATLQVAAAARTGRWRVHVAGLRQLARVRRLRGDGASARQILTDALEQVDVEATRQDGRVPERERLVARSRLLIELAEVERLAGNLSVAEARLGAAASIQEEAGDEGGAARLLLARGRLHAAGGDGAAARTSLREAIRLLQRAGSGLEAALALRELGWAEHEAGDALAADRSLSASLDLAERLGEWREAAEVLSLLGTVAARSGNVESAILRHRRALHVFRRLGDRKGETEAGQALGAQLLRAGQVAGAVVAWQDVVRLHAGAGGEEQAGITLAHLSLGRCASGEHADALAVAEMALRQAEATVDLPLEAAACFALGRVYAALGASSDSITWHRRSLAVATSLQDPLACSRALGDLGVLLAREGSLALAAERLQQGLEQAREGGDRALAATAAARLAVLRALQGSLGEAFVLVKEATGHAEAARDRIAQVEVRRVDGGLRCGAGDFDGGFPLLERALEDCRECGLVEELPAVHEALAIAHVRRALRLRTTTGAVLDREDIEAARAHVERGTDSVATAGRLAQRASLRCLAASVRLGSGDASRAEVEAREAERIAAETGDVLVASRCRLVRAEALLARREFAEALTLAKQALVEFQASSSVDDEWRAHALLSRLHATWGIADRAEVHGAAARDLLQMTAASLGSPALARVYRADVERAAILGAPVGVTGERARRLLPRALSTERFEGHVDAEDLVDALLEARRSAERLQVELEAARSRTRRGLARARLLESVGSELKDASVIDTDLLSRILGRVARALGTERALLLEQLPDQSLALSAASDGSASGPDRPSLSSLGVSVGIVRSVLATGRPGRVQARSADVPPREAGPAASRERRNAAGVPVRWSGTVRGVLVVDHAAATGRFRARDLRTLAAVAELLGAALDQLGGALPSSPREAVLAGTAREP